MLTALDTSSDLFDEHEKSFVANIREHGWFRTSVFAEGDLPGFSYTTGFWKSLSFPEIVAFSWKPETAHQIFWNLYNGLVAGEQILPERRIAGILENLDVFLMPVDKRHYKEYLGWNRWFYVGDEFSCFQLVWPDRKNYFPWQEEFDVKFADEQPDLSDFRWNKFAVGRK